MLSCENTGILVPRPSHCPVFGRLKYAKQRGRPSPLNEVSVDPGNKGVGVPNQRNTFHACVLCFELGAALFSGWWEGVGMMVEKR